MRNIVGYLRSYFQSIHPAAALLTTLVTAIFIAINYSLQLEDRLMNIPHYGIRFLAFTGLFFLVFGSAWALQYIFQPHKLRITPSFFVLLFLAPAVFALKVTLDWLTRGITLPLGYPWSQYWYMVLNWPLKCAVVLGIIHLYWRMAKRRPPVAGLLFQRFNARPYAILLLLMVPLVAFASTQADFLQTYPKMQRIDFLKDHVSSMTGWRILYEISYGIDFLTIETFFRGFLVLAFARYAGRSVILPMAAFYCAIHFGKPLFECISSYFGGMILGVVVYHTKNIWGGLIVHLGIAWLMELGGTIGQLYSH
ncbi:MAG: CPBP family intramembrane metalloprotease [Candidatus Pseudobacter hemicellulosilyticus]|uniref:CPBP family intramembrane metalloprotease n=1 Tax=Candidatus Pseudobacter hemicellulosilyticus TaxID=3121375 RepID=A0AAJ5WT54_9BACT|nr:MAG: CPBP family intramembrane metalloprotease [Pseudobacter sp.]